MGDADVETSDLEISCPVCRATQAAAATCRRCRADLGLFVFAVTSSRIARRRLALAIAAGDAASQAKLEDYLRWLDGRRESGAVG